MFIHHVSGIDWLVITAFEELKPMFYRRCWPNPSYFSSNSELSLIDQAKRSYGFLPTLRGVITDTGTYQVDLEEDLGTRSWPVSLKVVGECSSITATTWLLFDEQTFITEWIKFSK